MRTQHRSKSSTKRHSSFQSSDDSDRAPVELSGILAEFRTALQEEIEAARRNESGTAIPLTNGRLIAQVAGNFQYVFNIENALNLPGDAPGELRVPGRDPVRVAIVSVEGLALTLSVPLDLGTFVPAARLQSNLAFLMLRLIERIEDKAHKANPAGKRILRQQPVSGQPMDLPRGALNEEQHAAVASSLGRNTTFIWGPPGTGKTTTIGAIGRALFERHRSILLVSHTNTAVDQALLRIADKIPNKVLEIGKVLRVGDPSDPRFQKKSELLLATHVARRSEELSAEKDRLVSEREQAMTRAFDVSRQIELLEWVLHAERDISRFRQDLSLLHGLEGDLEHVRQAVADLGEQESYWANAGNTARKLLQQEKVLAQLRFDEQQQSRDRDAQQEATAARDTTLAEEEALLERTSSLGLLTRLWKGLPSPEKQEQAVGAARGKAAEQRHDLEKKEAELSETNLGIDEIVGELVAFRNQHGSSPADIIARGKVRTKELQKTRARWHDISGQVAQSREALTTALNRQIFVLRDQRLTSASTGSVESMLEAIEEAHQTVRQLMAGEDVDQLKNEHMELATRIRTLEAEIQRIEEALKKVEDAVIADATIIATTLTRAYLRDSIQGRSFDTVILDEASMAPIPALWVAASLAKENAVVAGDFMQLPPIVVSNDKLAKKWLGRDIFDHAGLSDLTSTAAHRIDLRQQHRMHPAISSIANAHAYNGVLRDAEETRNDQRLGPWYRRDWGHDQPVLLLDTGPAHAWVTSVVRGSRSSRLNFLSATISVDLSEQLLHPERTPLKQGDRPRIFLVCPYRPHAKLMGLLLREQRLENEVRAGTAHSFQGSEADVVILDLVNDEPHWRVGMFMPQNDAAMLRLLNVALTRARCRLLIVGDFDYIATHGKKAFLGSLVRHLRRHYPCINALDVVPTNLHARAAAAQDSVLGGPVEADHERQVVTQDKFFPMLRTDIGNATSRIVIFSAFMTRTRLGEIQLSLTAAVERGIDVFVVTKPLEERSAKQRQEYWALESALTEWGIVVVHKRRMHEKLVFVDDTVLWLGSLNPLSHSDTQEIMERRVSTPVVNEFSATLRLKDLVGEYVDGTPKCPICNSEVVASEGSKKPFYWRCVEDDCYTRDIDQRPIKDGVLTCSNCGGKLEIGEWGGELVWRCRDNRKHRRRIAKTHLRLPKMRAGVSKRKLRQLEQRFGTTFAN